MRAPSLSLGESWPCPSEAPEGAHSERGGCRGCPGWGGLRSASWAGGLGPWLRSGNPISPQVPVQIGHCLCISFCRLIYSVHWGGKDEVLGAWTRAELGDLCQVPRVSILWVAMLENTQGWRPHAHPLQAAGSYCTRRTRPLQPAMPLLPGAVGLAGLLFWAGQTVNTLMPNATLAPARTEGTAVWPPSDLGVARYRRKRYISARDMSALLDYHNHIRASVHPPAANMEYMVSLHAPLSAPSSKCRLSQRVLEGLDHSPAWPY